MNSKKRSLSKDICAAINKNAREEELFLHGHSIFFRSTITKNKKKYNRKQLKKIEL